MVAKKYVAIQKLKLKADATFLAGPYLEAIC